MGLEQPAHVFAIFLKQSSHLGVSLSLKYYPLRGLSQPKQLKCSLKIRT